VRSNAGFERLFFLANFWLTGRVSWVFKGAARQAAVPHFGMAPKIPFFDPLALEGGVAEQVRFEQIRTLYANSIATLVATLLAGLVVAAILGRPGGALAGDWRLNIWLTAVVVLTLWRFGAGWRFLAQAAQPHPPGAQTRAQWVERSARGFVVVSLFSGALWGGLGALAFDPGTLMASTFVALVLTATASAALGSLAVYLPAFAAFVLPACLPMIGLFLTDETPELRGLGVLGLVFVVVYLAYGKSFNRALLTSIALRFENQQLLSEVAVQRDAALRADRDKTALLAAATHDLRQPAYAAGLYAESLKAGLALCVAKGGLAELDAAELTQLAKQTATSVNGFNSLLEGVLDVAQLDAQALPAAREPVRLADLLGAVCTTLEATAAERGLVLRVRANPALWVHAPPDALQRIVLNLTSNAIKFTTGKRVLLFARLHRGQVRIGVMDTGPGIALADQQRMFEPFTRLLGRKSQAGLGLGLAIVKRQAAQLGAPIELRSALGKSSVFSLQLPPYVAPQAVEERSDAVQVGQKGSLADTLLGKCQALVLDDDPLVRGATADVLRSMGLEPQLLASVDEAFEWLEQRRPCASEPMLLVLDMQLADPQGRDGLDVLRAFQQRSSGAAGTPCCDLRALLVTGETDAAQLRRIADSAVRVLRKPCKAQALRLAVLGLALA
jgi:signal transduction histidine kinase/ActR/RegA family two-component response regulator